MSGDPTARRAISQVGRYRLYDKLASGGMAAVYLGRLVGEGGFARVVAIKRLHPQYAEDPEFVAMFTDEARLAARIRHPNVVPTVDVVRDGDELLLVMEYVHGVTLSHLMRALQGGDARIPLPVTSAVIGSALAGLHAAHEARGEDGTELRLVHRDVSPQNVMVGTDGATRVLDFGVAKAVSRSRTTQDGRVRGKFAYMAPEQMESGDVTRQTDVYAAGVMLWECLTGKRLFEGANDAALVNQVLNTRIRRPSEHVDIPATLDGIVMRALSRAPAKRFRTAQEMAEALNAVVAPAPTAEVAAFVIEVAGSDLAEREQLIAAVESGKIEASGVTLRPTPQTTPDSPEQTASTISADPADTVAMSSPSRSGEEVSEGTGALLSSSVATTTEQAVLRFRGRRRATMLGALGLGGVAVIGWLVWMGLGDPAGSSVAPATSERAPAAPDLPQPAAPEASSTAEALPSASATADPAPTARPAPVRRAPAERRSPRKPKPGCNPPFTVDAKGHKHFKVECL